MDSPRINTRLQRALLCLALGVVLTGCPQSMADVEQAGNTRDLAVAVEAKGGTVYYRDLEIMAEIGSFEIYRSTPKGRSSILFGPKIPKNRRGQMQVPLLFEQFAGPIGYTYELKWIGPATLRVRLAYSADYPGVTGDSICIGKLAAGYFAGSQLLADGKKTRLPYRPRPIEDRVLFSDKDTLSIASAFVDITIKPVNSPGISMADFRLVPWDNRKSFYLYASRKIVVPGEKVSLCYDIAFGPPSLTAASQYDEAPAMPAPPAPPQGAQFFAGFPAQAEPELPVRGVLTELLPPARKDLRMFKGYLNAIARTRGNTVILNHSPEHVLQLQAGEVKSRWWSREELLEIAIYGKSLGIDIVPGMTSKFTAEVFPQLVSGEGKQFYDPFNERSYIQLFSLYETLIDIYRPTAFFIGHDEIRNIGRTKPREWTDARVLAYDVTKIHDWLKERGVKTLIAGDMLLDRNFWDHPIVANSNRDLYGGVDTHLAIDLLPKDIVILDWQYETAADYPTIKYFKEKGFPVWGVAWYKPESAVAMARSLTRYGGQGILASDWGLWRTMSPAATTLYAVKAGWESRIGVNGNGEDAVAALAEEMRLSPIVGEQDVFTPVSLAESANETTRDETFGDERGFFDLGGGFDFRSLPGGEQHFAGIQFFIMPYTAGASKNCIIAAGPSMEVLPLKGLRAKKLAFLQTMRSTQPQIFPRCIGGYEVVYASGKKAVIELKENDNITDFRSTAGVRKSPWGYDRGLDILLGSSLGWRGTTLSGATVNLQVMIWENPDPQIGITEIRLLPAQGYRLALLALSAS